MSLHVAIAEEFTRRMRSPLPGWEPQEKAIIHRYFLAEGQVGSRAWHSELESKRHNGDSRVGLRVPPSCAAVVAATDRAAVAFPDFDQVRQAITNYLVPPIDELPPPGGISRKNQLENLAHRLDDMQAWYRHGAAEPYREERRYGPEDGFMSPDEFALERTPSDGVRVRLNPQATQWLGFSPARAPAHVTSTLHFALLSGRPMFYDGDLRLKYVINPPDDVLRRPLRVTGEKGPVDDRIAALELPLPAADLAKHLLFITKSDEKTAPRMADWLQDALTDPTTHRTIETGGFSVQFEGSQNYAPPQTLDGQLVAEQKLSLKGVGSKSGAQADLTLPSVSVIVRGSDPDAHSQLVARFAAACGIPYPPFNDHPTGTFSWNRRHSFHPRNAARLHLRSATPVGKRARPRQSP